MTSSQNQCHKRASYCIPATSLDIHSTESTVLYAKSTSLSQLLLTTIHVHTDYEPGPGTDSSPKNWKNSHDATHRFGPRTQAGGNVLEAILSSHASLMPLPPLRLAPQQPLLMRRLFWHVRPWISIRHAGRFLSMEAASHRANKIQIYRSRSSDPLLNLSVEHHLLQNTPPDSTVLLFYVNSPCIVFGRNQNPWLETNLPRLARALQTNAPVQLIRRRSGGGSVFHDGGNVNFSVICPSAAFDRRKHGEMVVRALRALGRPTARVNSRHDIVIDGSPDPAVAAGTTLCKVSGSAFKLTRLRSLHHGTCLLRSPNLGAITGLLRSPAEPFIMARGVESVHSPVRNLDLDNAAFEDAVVEQFLALYGASHVNDVFDAMALDVDEIKAGYNEIRHPRWIYGQTPRFTFSTHPFKEDPRARPQKPTNMKMRFEAKHGQIEQILISEAGRSIDTGALVGSFLHEIADWSRSLTQTGMAQSDALVMGTWLNKVLGARFTQAP